ncbi:hypothetical protein BDN67DRAFT_660258 [Paxillus ammoniavirescens]|nr:hypothetical protein BDN67DRAFT_660258 [Paxillus ammoniavirescens]
MWWIVHPASCPRTSPIFSAMSCILETLADEHASGLAFSTSYSRQQVLFLASPCPLACLLALDKASPHNWLDDSFWMKKTYLEWRAPLLINSNLWLTFLNDWGVPVVTDESFSLGKRGELRVWSWCQFQA